MYSDDTVHMLSNYITALHILHSQHVLDGYGHLSIRNPENPQTFFLFHTVPSALVSSLNDIGEYYIADATPANSSTPEGFKERFIHSEILKRYKSVNVVLHGHSEELLIYSLGGERLQPVIHMAGFLGNSRCQSP
jgi:Ribulose-5-phosphate 4-epimerase and related epimerases and aldolases